MPTAFEMVRQLGQIFRVRELPSEESGQDVIEYALLTAIIGVAAIAIWNALVGRVGVVYGEADAGVQSLSACTPDPGGGGCS